VGAIEEQWFKEADMGADIEDSLPDDEEFLEHFKKMIANFAGSLEETEATEEHTQIGARFMLVAVGEDTLEIEVNEILLRKFGPFVAGSVCVNADGKHVHIPLEEYQQFLGDPEHIVIGLN
jgi:hypothetical protein